VPVGSSVSEGICGIGGAGEGGRFISGSLEGDSSKISFIGNLNNLFAGILLDEITAGGTLAGGSDKSVGVVTIESLGDRGGSDGCNDSISSNVLGECSSLHLSNALVGSELDSSSLGQGSDIGVEGSIISEVLEEGPG